MSLEFEDKTFVLRKCFFEVQNEVGRGRDEQSYHRACELWFAEHDVPALSKSPLHVTLRGSVVHVLCPDFVCWSAISVALLSAPRHLGRADYVRLFEYLKIRGDRLGLLVNMGLERVEIDRLVYDPPNTEWAENWQSWTDRIDGAERTTGLAIRGAIRAVYDEHTPGFGEAIVTKLVHRALKNQDLAVVVDPVAKATYRGRQINESELSCFVINDRIVLTLSALFDNNDFNVSRCRSYLKALGLRWGIAVDFGKTRTELIGLRVGP